MNSFYDVTIPCIKPKDKKFDLDEGIYLIMRILGEYALKRKHSWSDYADDLPHGFLVDGLCASSVFYQSVCDLLYDLSYKIEDVFFECRNYQNEIDEPVHTIRIHAVWFAECKEACFVPDLIECKCEDKRIRTFIMYEDNEWPFYYDHPNSDVYSAYFGVEPDKEREPDYHIDNYKKYYFAKVELIAEITDPDIGKD